MLASTDHECLLALHVVRSDQLAQAGLQPFELGCCGRLVAGLAFVGASWRRTAGTFRALRRVGGVPVRGRRFVGSDRVCMKSKWQSSCAGTQSCQTATRGAGSVAGRVKAPSTVYARALAERSYRTRKRVTATIPPGGHRQGPEPRPGSAARRRAQADRRASAIAHLRSRSLSTVTSARASSSVGAGARQGAVRSRTHIQPSLGASGVAAERRHLCRPSPTAGWRSRGAGQDDGSSTRQGTLRAGPARRDAEIR
jgi:hypothetical protein